MAGGNDINYWWLIFIGAMLLGALLLVLTLRQKPREQEMSDPDANAGVRQVYEEEQRLHQNDPGSGL